MYSNQMSTQISFLMESIWAYRAFELWFNPTFKLYMTIHCSFNCIPFTTLGAYKSFVGKIYQTHAIPWKEPIFFYISGIFSVLVIVIAYMSCMVKIACVR